MVVLCLLGPVAVPSHQRQLGRLRNDPGSFVASLHSSCAIPGRSRRHKCEANELRGYGRKFRKQDQKFRQNTLAIRGAMSPIRMHQGSAFCN